MRAIRSLSIIVSAYIVLSIIFTWPLITKIATAGFGHDEDSPYHIWHNWWFKYSVFDLKQNPLYTNYIFHPQKINLIYDANAFVFSAMTLPIQALTNNVVLSSNIIFLLSFALSGLFAFILADDILKNKPLAFLCGFIFALNPYTLAQAIDGHINLTSTWMIPLYTFFLLKSLNSGMSDKVFRIQNFKFQIAAGITAALQLYNDFTYSAFLIIETVIIFGFFVYSSRCSEERIKPIKKQLFTGLVVAGTASIIGSPLLYEVVVAAKGGLKASSPTWVQNVWSADLLTFIRPNDQTTFLKNPWTPQIGTVEGTAFLGYSVIVLAVIYLLLRITKRLQATAGENLMLVLTISFFLLMLGPSIHYRNSFQFPFFGTQFIFPLPYLILHKIPFIGETQEPGRMFPFLILPLSMLASSALGQMSKNLKKSIFYLLLTSYFLLLAIEYLPLPFPTTDLSSKPIFDIIQKDPENKAVLVLPLGFNSGNYVLGPSPIGSLQFYQAYFRKPSFRGTVARLPYSTFEYYQNLPLIPYLIDPKRDLKDSDLDKTTGLKILKDRLNVKYVIVIEDKYKGPMGQTYQILENTLGATKFYDEGRVKGYIL
jgi:hypothetical protein